VSGVREPGSGGRGASGWDDGWRDRSEAHDPADSEPSVTESAAWAVHGVPVDAQQLGLDRHTAEGSMLAMAGSLDGARWTHKVVAWVLLVVFVSPVLLTLSDWLGWW